MERNFAPLQRTYVIPKVAYHVDDDIQLYMFCFTTCKQKMHLFYLKSHSVHIVSAQRDKLFEYIFTFYSRRAKWVMNCLLRPVEHETAEQMIVSHCILDTVFDRIKVNCFSLHIFQICVSLFVRKLLNICIKTYVCTVEYFFAIFTKHGKN